EDERRHGRQRGLHPEIELDVRMVFPELALPIAAEKAVGDVVAAPHADRSAHLGGRLVVRQLRQIELLRVGDLFPASLHHPGPRRLHVEAFGGLLAFLRQRGGGEHCSEGARNHDGLAHDVSPYLIFASSARAAAALSGRYLPSFCTSSWPSREST